MEVLLLGRCADGETGTDAVGDGIMSVEHHKIVAEQATRIARELDQRSWLIRPLSRTIERVAFYRRRCSGSGTLASFESKGRRKPSETSGPEIGEIWQK